jgi:hypothetical protein
VNRIDLFLLFFLTGNVHFILVWEFVISFVIEHAFFFFVRRAVPWPTTQNPLLLVVPIIRCWGTRSSWPSIRGKSSPPACLVQPPTCRARWRPESVVGPTPTFQQPCTARPSFTVSISFFHFSCQLENLFSLFLFFDFVCFFFLLLDCLIFQ